MEDLLFSWINFKVESVKLQKERWENNFTTLAKISQDAAEENKMQFVEIVRCCSSNDVILPRNSYKSRTEDKQPNKIWHRS